MVLFFLKESFIIPVFDWFQLRRFRCVLPAGGYLQFFLDKGDLDFREGAISGQQFQHPFGRGIQNIR